MTNLKFNERIARIPVYPAADGYALGEDTALLASNEAPFAPLPEVAAAAAEAAAAAHRYPDPGSGALRLAISERSGVPAERIAVGNGSCDILLALGEALLAPGAEIVYAWPSFSIYPHLAAASGATAVTVDLDGEARHDVDAMAAAVTDRTRLLIICNPNNPTSTAIPMSEVQRLIEQVPDSVCVVLDEAYREFVRSEPIDAGLELLSDHPNLIILRSFSKVYGLAALRVGYGLCGDAAIRTAVDQVRQPFFCNAAAQAAAVESLAHGDEITRRVELMVAERAKLAERLEQIGCHVADSQANFLWVRLPEGVDEQTVVKGLAQMGVLVRAGTALGEAGRLRITVGLPEQHERLIQGLIALIG
jgi:histidinol-phosphate aminotransferase